MSDHIEGSKADIAEQQKTKRPRGQDVTAAVALPSAAEMERAALGAIMQASEVNGPAALRTLREEDFAIEAHGIVFRLLMQLLEAGSPVEPSTVVRRLYDQSLVDRVGGSAIVSECYSACPNPAHFGHYAAEIVTKAKSRAIIRAAWDTAERILGEPTRENVEAQAMALVDTLLLTTRSGDTAKIVHIKDPLLEGMDELEEAMKNRGHVLGEICTGYTDLDRALLKGLPRGTMHIIAGDTGSGKTALAVCILLNMALARGHYRQFYNWDSSYTNKIHNWKAALAEGRGTPRHKKLKVLMVCLESSQTEMALQMLMGEAEVDLRTMYGGFMDRTVMPRLQGKCLDLVDSQIYLWDAPGITVEELAAEVKHFKMRHPDLAVVCVDHIGLLGTHAIRDKGNETAITGYVSNALLRLYQQTNVVGLSLVQLNREAADAGSKGKRPTRAMMRSSGKVEQDAYTILMPYRPAHYIPDADPDEAYIVIAKARGCAPNLNGVPMLWNGPTKRFLSAYKWTEEMHERLKATDYDLAAALYEKYSYGDIVERDELFSVKETSKQVRTDD